MILSPYSGEHKKEGDENYLRQDKGIWIEWYILWLNYSVTQSFANSFWGDVVLDTFSNVSGDEDNILDQIYIKQICSEFYYDDFWFS